MTFLKRTFFILILFALTHGYAQDEEAYIPPLPEKWQEYVEFERNYNLGMYGLHLLKDTDPLPVKVYHYDIPKSIFNKISGFSYYKTKDFGYDVSLSKSLFQMENYSKGVRIFSLEPLEDKVEFIEKFEIVQKQEYWAYRIGGQNSFFTWSPDKINKDPFILKFSSTEEYRDSFNGNTRGIKATEVLQEGIMATKTTNVAILPERLFTSIMTETGIRLKTTVRSLNPVTGDIQSLRKSKDLKLYPVHGLMGNLNALQKFAGLAGYEKTHHWVEGEYLKQLAEYYSELMFVHGAWMEPHTQNLNIIVNTKTGKVDRFVGKDLPETAFDNHFRSSIFKKFNLKKYLLRGYTFIHIWDKPVSQNSISKPIDRVATVLSKSILDLSGEAIDQVNYSRLFVDNFISKTQKVIGIEIKLKGKALKAYDRLFNTPHTEIESYNYFIPGELPLLIGRILEEVHKQATLKTLPKITDKMIIDNQAYLKEAFNLLYRNRKSVTFEEDLFKKLKTLGSLARYATDGEKIYVYNRLTKNILAYVFDINYYFEVLRAYGPFSGTCKKIFLAPWNN